MKRKMKAPQKFELIKHLCEIVYICMTFLLGTDEENHEYEYLNAWGPRFGKLADMYGPDMDEQL